MMPGVGVGMVVVDLQLPVSGVGMVMVVGAVVDRGRLVVIVALSMCHTTPDSAQLPRSQQSSGCYLKQRHQST